MKYPWQVRGTGLVEQFPNLKLRAFILLLLCPETVKTLSLGPNVAFFRLCSLEAKSTAKLYEGSSNIEGIWFTFLIEYINEAKDVTKC